MRNRYFYSLIIISLILLGSCREESLCDTAGYTIPEIFLISPEGPNIEVPADSLSAFEFFFKAEAGLNTFSMNGQPIHAFTNGEIEAELIFKRYFWENEKLEFKLYDLCNQATSLTVNLTVNYSNQ